MKMYLKELNISDWKGFKKESFGFSPGENFVSGKNGTGKTSLFASVVWLFFGKDNFDRTDHQIRPLVDGEPKHRINSEVEGVFILDGVVELRLRRVYSEIWTKPKTAVEEVYKGNTTEFYINDVKVQKKDYDAKVADLFSEQVFKAVTNPHYVTSQQKEDQRKMLFGLIDKITDEQVAKGNKDFEELLQEISGVNFAMFKKNLAAKTRKIQEEIDDIDPRINELNRNKPEPLDWTTLEKQVKEKEDQLKKIEASISDVAKKSEQENERRLEIQRKINSLKNENEEIESEQRRGRQKEVEVLRNQILDIETEITNKQRDGKGKQARLDYLLPEKERLVKERAKLLAAYNKINEESLIFPDGSFDCPACKRPLEVDDIEKKQSEMKEDFNRSKAEKLSSNITKGKAIRAQIEEIDKEIKEIGDIKIEDVSGLEKKQESLKGDLLTLQTKPFEPTEKKKSNEEEILKLKALLETPREKVSDESLTKEKDELKSQIKAINSDLAKKESIERTEKRIAELKRQHKNLNQEKADLEKKEFTIRNFEDAQRREYESRINELFSIVQFRLFRKQIDGQVVPDCECMVDGVLYSTLNNAAQIAAGLDIIKAFSRRHNLYAPIFIDNRESVTDLPEMETQLINLVVDPRFDTLVLNGKVGKTKVSEGVLDLRME